MIYKVLCDGVNIYGSSLSMTLLSPSLSTELNAAGSFNFKMPPNHTHYGDVNLLTSLIEVYENDEVIWFGRAIESKISLRKEKEVYCEGALAFFNDTIQLSYEYESTTVANFFTTVIQNHNNQVTEFRRFTVGEISDSIGSKLVYRKLDYETTMDVLTKMCLDAEGGYLFLRREDGVNYIDWLDDVPYLSNQPITLTKNLVDITNDTNLSGLKTAVIPFGAKDRQTGEPINIAIVNHGILYVESEIAIALGLPRITVTQTFDDITDPQTLKDTGIAWIESQVKDLFTLEISAADLSAFDSSYGHYKLGQKVTVNIPLHGITTELPIIKLDVKLDSGAKGISIGTQKAPVLTEIYKNGDGSLSSGSGGSKSSYSSGGSSYNVSPNNGILTISKNGVSLGTFGANSAADVTINVPVPSVEVNNGILTLTQNGTTLGTFGANSAVDVDVDIPSTTANDGVLTLIQNGITLGTFSADSASDVSITIPSGSGGGSVTYDLYSGTLDANSWSGASEPYTQTASVNGIRSTDIPILDLVLSSTYSTAKQENEAWCGIISAESSTDAIIFTASSIPSVDLDFHAIVIRNV